MGEPAIDMLEQHETGRVSAPTVPDVMTAEEAAVFLRLNIKTLREYAAKGTIPGQRIGDTWRFSKPGLMAWLAGNAPEPKARGRR